MNPGVKEIPLRFNASQKEAVRNLLAAPADIVIVTHHRPDGDAMGSSLGLYNYLKKKGNQVHVVVPSAFPDFLDWLPGSREVLNYEIDAKKCDRLIQNAKIVFCLDFNWFSRVDKMENVLRTCTANKILIDHHLDPEDAFQLSLSYQDVSSTSELIFDLILALDDTENIDKKIAECIYCGIMTDTNSFRFSSMKARTHRIVALLIETGIEHFLIHERVYDNTTEHRLRMLGYALLNKLVLLKEFHTAYIALSEEELKRFDNKVGDTEGFVNEALSIKGVRMAAFFSEREGSVRISFRSKLDFSVKDLAAEHFNGGGHKNASGGMSHDTLENTIKKFIEILPQYQAQLTDQSAG